MIELLVHVMRRAEGVSAALALLALAWASTALLQAPRHRTFGLGFDPGSHRFLVASNWARTAAWSARGGVVLARAAEAIG